MAVKKKTTAKKQVKKPLDKKPVKKKYTQKQQIKNTVQKQYVIAAVAKNGSTGFYDGTAQTITGFDTNLRKAVLFQSFSQAKAVATKIRVTNFKIGIAVYQDLKKKHKPTR